MSALRLVLAAAVMPTAIAVAAGSPAGAPAPRNPIGVFMASTGQADAAAALAAARRVGVDTIQISKLPDHFYSPAGAREFAGLLKANGLHAAAVVVVFDGESYADIHAVEETVGFRPASLVEARVAYARKCVDFAAALDIPIVTFHAGVLPKEPADPIYQRMLDATTRVATYAAARGTSISLETGQETSEELVRFIDAIEGARVGVNFDTANLVLYGTEDPPAALRRLVGRVTSVHVKDGLPPASPGALGKEVRLGEGRAGVASCLEILRNAGFTGPLIIENYVFRNLQTDPLDELRRAKAFVERTIEALAIQPSRQ
jgi:L-ribulose-5-phosphate 3-epimerase